MKVIQRKEKPFRSKGHYYFGDYDTTPSSISVAFIKDKKADSDSDPEHYHNMPSTFQVS
jgi:hypothetical protein